MKKKTTNDAQWSNFTTEEKKKFKKAFVNTFGKVGLRVLDDSDKKKAIHIKLDSEVIKKFKTKAKKTGKSYQT